MHRAESAAETTGSCASYSSGWLCQLQERPVLDAALKSLWDPLVLLVQRVCVGSNTVP